MSGFIGGAPAPAPTRRDVLSEKFPEAVAAGRVQVEAPAALDTSSAPGAPQGGYKVRTLSEQIAENRRKADEDFLDERKPKGPKALDDEEFEFIEGTQLARLKKRLMEEAEEKEALADFHARKASLVHDAAEVLLVAKPDVPDVAKRTLAPAPKAPAFKIIAVAKSTASSAASAPSASSSHSSSSSSASASQQPPAKSARSEKQSPSPVASAPPKAPAPPPAPTALALLGAYGNSDEEG